MTNKPDYFVDNLLKDFDSSSALDAIFKAQDDCAKVGFDFKSIENVIAKVKEEHQEIVEAYDQIESDKQHFAEELGDNFFALVNLARHTGLNPEEICKANAKKYILRCKFIEDRIKSEGKAWKDMQLDEIQAYWREAKRNGF